MHDKFCKNIAEVNITTAKQMAALTAVVDQIPEKKLIFAKLS